MIYDKKKKHPETYYYIYNFMPCYKFTIANAGVSFIASQATK
jgi:hypothetical protein